MIATLRRAYPNAVRLAAIGYVVLAIGVALALVGVVRTQHEESDRLVENHRLTEQVLAQNRTIAAQNRRIADANHAAVVAACEGVNGVKSGITDLLHGLAAGQTNVAPIDALPPEIRTFIVEQRQATAAYYAKQIRAAAALFTLQDCERLPGGGG